MKRIIKLLSLLMGRFSPSLKKYNSNSIWENTLLCLLVFVLNTAHKRSNKEKKKKKEWCLYKDK